MIMLHNNKCTYLRKSEIDTNSKIISIRASRSHDIAGESNEIVLEIAQSPVYAELVIRIMRDVD
jgi:hypothetical protein